MRTFRILRATTYAEFYDVKAETLDDAIRLTIDREDCAKLVTKLGKPIPDDHWCEMVEMVFCEERKPYRWRG